MGDDHLHRKIGLIGSNEEVFIVLVHDKPRRADLIKNLTKDCEVHSYGNDVKPSGEVMVID